MLVVFGHTIINNLVSDNVPEGLNLDFPEKLQVVDRKQVEDTVSYWLKTTAINQEDYTITWLQNGKTLDVRVSFESGYFKGDLTHHNALTSGDEDFKIGLCKLFYYGLTPKTSKGKYLPKLSVKPLEIRILYPDKC